MDLSKFTFNDWIKIGAVFISIIALFLKVEYLQGEVHELKGQISVLQTGEKSHAVTEGAISQQLNDISQRLIRIENKMDASR